jgi:hypothetical protein
MGRVSLGVVTSLDVHARETRWTSLLGFAGTPVAPTTFAA